ncbi:RagB/SusD family nutrient uptake outer membrane protein [Sphingobacterium chuzhouense]|uniref:RagB/SusD family nutrient uptake outer membrane protein n=1 Tax=Sphingobacterium chuzhouense TaxID=1742264 RepID=A0ABR7XUR7_9SPHI|nr:RagB/SusD family nutrient uptake outer membrane protein [Sphingobacterium chuzhouense]MBD1422783.1 RagB/SusD family nutrient uptake outer membrane protein [Sphingobacterium chuzhouense]
MKYLKTTIIACIIAVSVGCNKWIDVVPDNVASLEYAFRMRSTAERYMAGCYSYIPNFGSMYYNPGLYGADEFWLSSDKATWTNWNIARGQQSVSSPLINYWTGGSGGTDLWEAISECNIFLEHIGIVPDMDNYEKRQWAAEVKFLKAYYHFLLLRSYGPIPIMRENIPISASGEEVRVFRRPVDEVFEYIVELITEAEEDLPLQLMNENSEYGRITLPIALGYKAKILTYAASPLFNGNSTYANFANHDGTVLFNIEYSEEKWKQAVDALEQAIMVAHLQGYQLYEFPLNQQTQNIPDSLHLGLTNRGTVTDQWNREIIWGHNSSTTQLQTWIQPKALSEEQRVYSTPNGSTGVPLKIASLFYTENGVPIDEDRTWDYNNRYGLKVAEFEDRYYIKQGETTVAFNFDREPRFYGSLGFDRGIWYGQGNFNQEEPYWLRLMIGEFGGKQQAGWHSVTGYYAKKLVHYTNSNSANSTYNAVNYPWVILRLGDLYLLYAEALNELNGPTAEVYDYLDRIRSKAGLLGVLDAWQGFSRIPDKPQTKEGLREIIQRERAIDMAFEGERFWDLRRWRTAPDELNQPITGWDVDQNNTIGFYRERVLFDQQFRVKDYFWPIQQQDLIVNKNLVQNPGW